MDNFTPGSTVVTAPAADDSLCMTREPVSIATRLAARLFAPLLDRRLVADAVPKPGSALALHSARLTSAAERQRLAPRLQRLLEAGDAWSSLVNRSSPPTREADRMPRPDAACRRVLWSSPIPLNWSGINAASGLIDEVWMRLEEPHPVRARGVARLRLLLSASGAPLYPYSRRDLSSELRTVLDLL